MSNTVNDDQKESLVICKSNQGIEVTGAVLKLSRHSVSFEAHISPGTFRLSEALEGVQISARDYMIYSGRAVIRSMIDTGPTVVCEATLDESKFDVAAFSGDDWKDKLRQEFLRSVTTPRRIFKMQPEFKITIADLQMLFVDLKIWIEQVQLRLGVGPVADRNRYEKEALLALQEPVLSIAENLLEAFEFIAGKVEPDARALHMSYTKRQLHPLVLCSPFLHRTFHKPLGYAGDYEMVNMMVRDPHEGGSFFAKLLNYIFLRTPPVEAHRNRLVYLRELLRSETLRSMRKGRRVRIMNLGCGPAKEIQDFLTDELSNHAEFTLIDFNEETLDFASRELEGIKRQHRRSTPIQCVKKSVHQLLKEASKSNTRAAAYDFVYCAGLFDYLSDAVCKRLMGIFYDVTAPGGLIVATNVADSNPSVAWMEYVLDWHLNYRSPKQFASVTPTQVGTEPGVIRSIGDGVNIALEVNKPEHG